MQTDDANVEQAGKILAQFYSENSSADRYPSESELHPPLPALNRRGKTAAVMASLMLCLIHAATIYHDNHHQAVLDYGASALYILQGEYYRTITALMLHSDIEHLAGNVAGLLFLGIPLCSIMGAGRGLFLILLSGVAGNLLNAYMYRHAHLSIGASTAVMGAVGILAAWQLRKKIVKSVRNVKKVRKTCDTAEASDIAEVSDIAESSDIAEMDAAEAAHTYLRIDIKPSALFPLGAGAAVVGMLSGGENTDVSAHVFGFLSGLGATALYFSFSTFFRREIFPGVTGDFFKNVDNMDDIFIFIVAAVIFFAWLKV